jgi:hypothetical protein
MTVASVTAKRVSDSVIFQAKGNTPFTFSGLGAGVTYDAILPDGTMLCRMTLSAPSLTWIGSNAMILRGDETGTKNANSVTTLTAASPLGAIGTSTHTGSSRQSDNSLTISTGVRTA